MKQATLLAGLLAACIPAAQAVDLNKDALKSMQEEGYKMMSESKDTRAYKAAGGLCLEFAGAGLLVKKCNAQSNNQKWYFDEQQRLVAYNGMCVDAAKLKKCGSAATQKWKLDGMKRLANNKKQCLQTQGNPPKAGAKVVAAACSKAGNQVWK